MTQTSGPCPCGLPGTLESCCGRYVLDGLRAPDPEALMRSRYCAFTIGTPKAVEYLVETQHEDFRQPHLASALQATINDVIWCSLEVRETSHLNDEGLVEFTALYKHDEQLSQLQERSSFVREGGRWLYTTGHLDPVQNGPVED